MARPICRRSNSAHEARNYGRLEDSFTRFLGKDFYWHSLRHFFATFLSESNIPSSVIQDIVGWESADMVNLYVDTSADENIGKYFGEDGIKQVEQKGLSDL